MKIIQTKLDTTYHYVKLDLNTLILDDIVVFNIFIQKDENHVIIIEAGTKITQLLYNKLKKKDNLYISNKDVNKQIIDANSLMHYIKYNQKNYQKIMSILYEINEKLFIDFFNNIRNLINTKLITSILESIIYLIKNDSNFIRNSIELYNHDYKVNNHSLHVAIYSIQLGYLLKLNEKNLLKLSTAAILHDIGYKKINPLLETSRSKLSKDNINIKKTHVKCSIDIAKENKIFDPLIINAIAQHHENYDGSGYPNGLIEGEINEFASILAICDTFDKLTSNTPNQDTLNSYDALMLMTKDKKIKNQLNQNYLQIGISTILK